MFRFGNFEIHATGRELRRDGATLVVRARAFEVLLALVEDAGRVVSKRELCRRAWPGRDIDENNLQVEILGLRKLLGRQAIVTVPGRGYQFALAVQDTAEALDAADALETAPGDVPPGPGLPVAPAAPTPAPPLLGRDEDLCALDALLAPGALVTLTGEGGIGKSAVAAALARRRAALAAGSVVVVALDAPDADAPGAAGAPCATPWVPVASALGVPGVASVQDARGVIAALCARERLLVLDGCDRALEAVAAMVQQVRDACPGVALLSTSREILRVSGERIYRLGPLASGPADEHGAAPADDAAGAAPPAEAAALLLFRRHAPGLNWTAAERTAAAGLCRRLGGNPLAIRLAAGCANALGIAGLCHRLDAGMDLGDESSHGLPARQRSLRASLAWSLDLLSDADRAVFCELAALAQPFTLARVLALERLAATDRWDVTEALARLVEKSLVAADHTDPPHYRLAPGTPVRPPDRT